MDLLHGEEVRRYLCDGRLLPRGTVAGMLTRSEELDGRGLGLWVIEQNAVGARVFAGIAGLEPVSAEAWPMPQMEGGIEPIIALGSAHWGQGLARAALRALVAYAREPLCLPRLVAAVDEPNERSHVLMRACGFSALGHAPGPAHELVLYELQLGEAAK